MNVNHSVPLSSGPIADISPKVDCESATDDFAPNGNINGASFKTSISRMKRNFANLTASDKNRLAACFTNIEDPHDLKLILANVRIYSKACLDLLEMLTLLF